MMKIFCDFTVSCHGTWQRRGYASLNGLVTVISVDTGKVKEYEVPNKNSAQCSSWGRPMMNSSPPPPPPPLECSINYEGSRYWYFS